MTDEADTSLRLAAMDGDDLDIISAHTQDAVLTVADMTFRKNSGAFILMANRFDWIGGKRNIHKRRRTALHFDRVRGVRARNISPSQRAKVLNLLAIRYLPDGEEPAGTIELVFSGDAAMRLDVECVEARMTDIGPVWAAQSKPDHAAAADAAGAGV